VAVVLALSSSGAAVASTLTTLSLSARLIESSEFPGFVSVSGQSTTLDKTPQQWESGSGDSPAQSATDIARLRKEGFVAVVVRQLGTPVEEPWSGVSWVMQLGSPKAALSELAADVQEEKSTTKSPDTYRSFQVSGIPNARGYRLSGGSGTGYNVVFADGAFLYLLGFGWSSNPKNPPTQAQLIAAATKQDKRVHGHPAT
jgi:hypothetical protein